MDVLATRSRRRATPDSVAALSSGSDIHGVGIEPVVPPSITTQKGRTLPYGLLSYITRGAAHLSLKPGQRARFEAGTLLWVPAGQWHSLDPIDGPWCEYWLLFDAEAARSRFGLLLPEHGSISRIGVQASLLMPWRELLDLWFGDRAAYSAQLLFLLHTILFGIHSLRQRPAAPQMAGSVISRAVFRMHSELDEGNVHFDLRQLAATAGLSHDNLRKRFKKEVGLPLKQYWLDLKVRRAQALLVNPNHTVKDVAAIQGFDDPYYFSRLFKRKTHLSPSAFRRRA